MGFGFGQNQDPGTPPPAGVRTGRTPGSTIQQELGTSTGSARHSVTRYSKKSYSIGKPWDHKVTNRIAASALFDACEVIDTDPPETGWTEFILHTDAKIIYVGIDGDDANDGLSTNTSFATLDAAFAAVESGDWILAQRGFDIDIGSKSYSMPGGIDAEHPTLFGAWGDSFDPMPHIRTTAGLGIVFNSESRNFTAYVDIHFEGRGHVEESDGSFGIAFRGGTGHLVEGCWVQGFGHGINCRKPGVSNLTVRRSVLLDNWTEGIYSTDSPAGILIGDDTTFHNNGHSAGSHNAYILDTNNLIWKRVWCIQASRGNGLKHKQNKSMTVRDSIFALSQADCPVHIQANQPEIGIGNRTYDCLFDLAGQPDAPPPVESPHPSAINGQVDYEFRRNIILAAAHHTSGQQALALEKPYILQDVTIADNIFYGWTSTGIRVAPQNASLVSGISITGNSLINLTNYAAGANSKIVQDLLGDPAKVVYSGNRYHGDGSTPSDRLFGYGGVNMSYAEWVAASGETDSELVTDATGGYPDPTRNLNRYTVEVLGLGPDATFKDDMLPLLLQQRKGNWSTALEVLPALNYVRAGFNLVALAP